MQKEIFRLIHLLFFQRTGRGKMPRSWIGVLLLAVFGIILLFSEYFPSPPQPVRSPSSEHQWGEVRVEKCVDGDTIVIEGGMRVRLIGADTPETKKPNWPVEPFGPEASEFTQKAIEAAGNRVRLEPDGDPVDQFKRQLAMVYVDGVLLNEELIRQGLAVAKLQYRYSQEMKARFRAAEDDAKKAKRGIWSLGP